MASSMRQARAPVPPYTRRALARMLLAGAFLAPSCSDEPEPGPDLVAQLEADDLAAEDAEVPVDGPALAREGERCGIDVDGHGIRPCVDERGRIGAGPGVFAASGDVVCAECGVCVRRGATCE